MKVCKCMILLAVFMAIVGIGFGPVADAASNLKIKEPPLFKERVDKAISKMEDRAMTARSPRRDETLNCDFWDSCCDDNYSDYDPDKPGCDLDCANICDACNPGFTNDNPDCEPPMDICDEYSENFNPEGCRKEICFNENSEHYNPDDPICKEGEWDICDPRHPDFTEDNPECMDPCDPNNPTYDPNDCGGGDGVTISGKVWSAGSDGTQEPAVGMWVRVWDPETNEEGEARVQEDGGYVLYLHTRHGNFEVVTEPDWESGIIDFHGGPFVLYEEDDVSDGFDGFAGDWDYLYHVPVQNENIIVNIEVKKQVSVRGIVLDADGRPIPHAWVNVHSEKIGEGNGGETNGEGKFNIPVPKGPGYHINVDGKPGTGLIGGFFVDNDEKVTGDWEKRTLMEVGPEGISEVKIILGKGVSISGTVLDGAGSPVSEGWVHAWSEEMKAGGGSPLENGKFSIAVPEGEGYDLNIDAKADLGLVGGFFFDKDGDRKGGVTGDWEIRTLTDVGSDGVNDIEISLNTGVRIYGKVFDLDTKKAVHGFHVEARSEVTGAGGGSPTNEDGEFSIVVSSGPGYVVSCWPGEEFDFYGGHWRELLKDIPLLPNKKNGTLVPDWEKATLLDVKDRNVEINVIIYKSHTISGRVTDRDGMPVPWMPVEAVSKHTRASFGAETNEDGFYKIKAAPAPDYKVVAHGDGRFQTVFYKNAPNEEKAIPVDTTNGSAEGIDFVLSSGDTISGTISGLGEGKHAWIGVWSEDKQTGGGTEVKGTGTGAVGFEIGGLAPADDYRMDVCSKDHRCGHLKKDGKLGPWEEAALFDSNADNVGITLELGKKISGTISGLEEGDVLWIDACSESTRDCGGMEVIAKDTTADFTIEGIGSAKDFRVSVNSDRFVHGFYNEKVARLVPWDKATLIDTTDGNVTDVNVTVSAGRTISGTVSGLDEGELAWVDAHSEKTGSGCGAEVIGIGDGEDVAYEIKGLGFARDFRVSIHSDDYIGGFYGPTLTHWERAKLISTKDSDVDRIDFTLSTGKTISGKITGLDEGEWAEIEAWSKKAEFWGGTPVKGQGKGVPVDYEITGLAAADDYCVFFRPRGYKHEEQCDVDSASGDPISFTISEGKSISGTISLGTDHPYQWVWVDAFSEKNDEWGFVDVETDETGTAEYEIKGLGVADDYIVSAGAGRRHIFYKNTLFWREAARVNLSGSSATGIDFNFVESQGNEMFFTLSGTIAGLSDDDEDIVINIDAWDETTQASCGTERNGNGEFSIDLPAEGNYKIGIYAAGYADAYYGGPDTLVSDWEDAEAVSLTEDKDIGTLTFSADDVGYTISGTVTDSSGNGLADVTVEVTGADGTVLSTTTDSDGNYEVEVLDGDYTVSVISTSGNHEGSVTTSGSDATKDISLGAGNGTLAGTLTVANPLTVAGMMGSVGVYESDGTYINAIVVFLADSSCVSTCTGNYEISLPAGTYKIKTAASTVDGAVNNEHEGIVITADETTTLDDNSLKK